MLALSSLIFAFFITSIPLYGLFKRIDIFESSVSGGKTGFETVVRIIPFIVGMYVAIGMLQASGFLALVSQKAAPLLTQLGIPTEILPLALMRPISGSGSLALLTDIVEQTGPDSLASLTASTIMGSTETTIYVIAVYFGSIRVRYYRHALLTGLIADFAGIAASIIICQWLFS